MDEILIKLINLYNVYPELKDSQANVNMTDVDILKFGFTWGQLWTMIEYVEAYKDGVLAYVGETGPSPSELAHTNIKITGDCGAEHQSLQEWQECPDCSTVKKL